MNFPVLILLLLKNVFFFHCDFFLFEHSMLHPEIRMMEQSAILNSHRRQYFTNGTQQLSKSHLEASSKTLKKLEFTENQAVKQYYWPDVHQ